MKILYTYNKILHTYKLLICKEFFSECTRTLNFARNTYVFKSPRIIFSLRLILKYFCIDGRPEKKTEKKILTHDRYGKQE